MGINLLLGGQTFFTRDTKELLARAYITGLSTLTLFLPLSPKAMSFYPLFALFAFFFGWRAYKTAALPSIWAFIYILIGGAFLFTLYFWASAPDLHFRQSLIVLIYICSICFVWQNARFIAQENAERIVRIVIFATVLAVVIQCACLVGVKLGFFALDADHLKQVTFMLCGLLLYFFAVGFSERRARRALFLLALAAAAAMLSDSLSCKFSFFVALIVWSASSHAPRKALAIAIFAAALIIFLEPLLLPYLIDFIKDKAFVISEPSTFVSRLQIWDALTRALGRGEIFGHGLLSTRALDLTQSNLPYHYLMATTHTHNLPLALWYDLGLAGVGAFLLAWISFSQTVGSWQTNSVRCALTILTFLFVVSLFEYSIWFEWLIGFYGVVAALLALHLSSQQDKAVS